MRKINGFWVDDNNNRWNAHMYTETEAAEVAKTLTNCTDCTDCRDCLNCTYCRNCVECDHCIDCVCCTRCLECIDCTNCTRCLGCNHCENCARCSTCRYCSSCEDCNYCSYCASCRGLKSNPQRIVGCSMGSRFAQPFVYWTKEGKEQCVVGCFRGTLDELEVAARKTHKDNEEHRNAYLSFIKAVRNYQKELGD